MKHFNADRYQYFVLVHERQFKEEQNLDGTRVLRDNLGSISFRTYTDRTGALGKGAGLAVQYVVGRDERGRDKGKVFTFSQSHNAFKVNDAETDVYGIKQFDFLRCYPGCLDSPNGTYITEANGDKRQVNVEFKILNTEADADIALEATLLRSEAQLSAGKLDEQTLLEVAAIGIGFLGEPGQIMRHQVVEWAGKRPKDYFRVLDSGDRFVKALIRKGVKDGVLREQGDLIYWGNELIGTSEDSTIKYLVEHPDMMTALTERTKMKVPEKTQSTVKRPPGRPKSTQ